MDQINMAIEQMKTTLCHNSKGSVPVMISKDSDVCPICGGQEWIIEENNGLVYAEPCQCQAKAMMERRLRFANLPETFQNLRLNTFSVSMYQDDVAKNSARIACKSIKYYLENLDGMMKQGFGLYLWSDTKGSGKTRMAVGIANELIDRGMQVKFATSLDILQEIKNTWDARKAGIDEECEIGLLDALSTVEVLVIDDFGTESVKQDDWKNEKFYKIINERYLNRRPTILTSNNSLKTIKYDSRITNRLKERVFEIHFPEESVRESISKKNQEKFVNEVACIGKKNQ